MRLEIPRDIQNNREVRGGVPFGKAPHQEHDGAFEYMLAENILTAPDAVQVCAGREIAGPAEKVGELGKMVGGGEIVVRVHLPEERGDVRQFVIADDQAQGFVGRRVPLRTEFIQECIAPSVGGRHLSAPGEKNRSTVTDKKYTVVSLKVNPGM